MIALQAQDKLLAGRQMTRACTSVDLQELFHQRKIPKACVCVLQKLKCALLNEHISKRSEQQLFLHDRLLLY